MRENPSKTASNKTLSFNGFQTPYSDVSSNQKQMLFSVSSNVYYGYQHQPFTFVHNTAEPMHTEDLTKSNDEMDTTQREGPFVNRKRTRNHANITWDNCKKRRQNELQKPSTLLQRRSPSSILLEEDLLRETHGCSYYHWVASNI